MCIIIQIGNFSVDRHVCTDPLRGHCQNIIKSHSHTFTSCSYDFELLPPPSQFLPLSFHLILILIQYWLGDSPNVIAQAPPTCKACIYQTTEMPNIYYLNDSRISAEIPHLYKLSHKNSSWVVHETYCQYFHKKNKSVFEVVLLNIYGV